MENNRDVKQINRQLDNLKIQRSILDEQERFYKQQLRKVGVKPEEVENKALTSEDMAYLSRTKKPPQRNGFKLNN